MRVEITADLKHAAGVIADIAELKQAVEDALKNKCLVVRAESVPYQVTVWLENMVVDVSESVQQLAPDRGKDYVHISEVVKWSDRAVTLQAENAKLREAISDFVWNVKHQHVAGFADLRRAASADASFRQLSAALGKDV